MTASQRTAAWLVDERWAKAYPLGDEVTIGRGSVNTIILRDPAVSRMHAEIKRESGNYVLHAHGSSGTKVNGIRVGDTYDLREGDVVEIAFSTLRFTTRAPTNEMFVIPRDTPTYVDSHETPTRMTLRAIDRRNIARGWRRFLLWLTDRAKTD
jgi:pSer/pThr/pTyr-binding forkhead associated (FHA) protein